MISGHLKAAAFGTAIVHLASGSVVAQTGHRVEREFQGVAGSRRYAVWVPRDFDSRTERPLVVVLHGCLQNAADIARGTRFDERADEDGFLVLYPEQPAVVVPAKCWRWYDAAHQSRDSAGEPALLAALTQKVATDYHVDRTRVYVAGISAGGAMAVNILAAYPEIFAAGAAHSALPYRAAVGVAHALAAMRTGVIADSVMPERVLMASGSRREPRPLLVLNGGKDQVVAPRNGDALTRQWTVAVQEWLGQPLDSVVVDTTAGGRAARRVSYRASGRTWIEHWTILELGHAWSGGSSSGTYTDTAGPRATDLMAEFFGLRPRRR